MPSRELANLLDKLKERLSYEDSAHKYTLDGEQIPSVTQVLELLAKPDLIPWASKMQSEADLAVVKDWLAHSPPGVMATSLNVKALLDGLGKAKQAWKQESAKAKDIGLDAHKLIEHECKTMLGLPSTAPDVSDDARYVFAGWKEWAASVGFRPLAVEVKAYHPVYKYAGTWDVLAQFRDFPLAIGDWKSANGIYESHVLQLEAYQEQALSLGLPEDLTGVIVRLPKDKPGKIEVRWVPHSTEGKNAFLGLLTVYQWKNIS